jgi:hypothetical protein
VSNETGRRGGRVPPFHLIKDHPEPERRYEEHYATGGSRSGEAQEEAEDQG